MGGEKFTRMSQVASMRGSPPPGGEKLFQSPLFRLPLGSPPRGRGKEGLADRQAGVEGITPALAGKSQHGAAKRRLYRDHPRVGGEKWFWTSIPSGLVGAPPRRRGKDYSDCTKELRLGITPAWTGKMKSIRLRRKSLWDHPRRCREKSLENDRVNLRSGLSPQMQKKCISA